jgi:hypothetical protein
MLFLHVAARRPACRADAGVLVIDRNEARQASFTPSTNPEVLLLNQALPICTC